MKGREEKKISITKDEGCVLYKGLTDKEIKHLRRNGYRDYSFKGILARKKEIYLIKPRKSESPQHIFLVQDIANYIKKFTDKVMTYQTVKPDIVFEIHGKEYAIEVETGKLLKYNKKDLKNKIARLNKEYSERWFFVVTNRNIGSEYSKLNKTYDKRYVGTLIKRLLAENSK